MASLLEQLENNEAILLMYLAGELPPEDHAEVQHKLATDAGLRRALDELRAACDKVNAGLAAIDITDTSDSHDAFVHRQVMRELRRRIVEPPRIIVEKPVPKTLRYPWWVYPIAASAAVFFAFLAWWGNHDSQVAPHYGPLAVVEDIDSVTAKHLDSSLAESAAAARDQVESDRQFAILTTSFDDDASLLSPEFRR